jgi:hypothetical protein
MRGGGADALRLNNTKRDMRHDRAVGATATTTAASRQNAKIREEIKCTYDQSCC